MMNEDDDYPSKRSRSLIKRRVKREGRSRSRSRVGTDKIVKREGRSKSRDVGRRLARSRSRSSVETVEEESDDEVLPMSRRGQVSREFSDDEMFQIALEDAKRNFIDYFPSLKKNDYEEPKFKGFIGSGSFNQVRQYRLQLNSPNSSGSRSYVNLAVRLSNTVYADENREMPVGHENLLSFFDEDEDEGDFNRDSFKEQYRSYSVWSRASEQNLCPKVLYYGYIRTKEQKLKNPTSSEMVPKVLCIISIKYKSDVEKFYKKKHSSFSLYQQKKIDTLVVSQLKLLFTTLAKKLRTFCFDIKPKNMVINYKRKGSKGEMDLDSLQVRLIDLDGDFCLDQNFLKTKGISSKLILEASCNIMVMIMANFFYFNFNRNIFQNSMQELYLAGKRSNFLDLKIDTTYALFCGDETNEKLDEENNFFTVSNHYFQEEFYPVSSSTEKYHSPMSKLDSFIFLFQNSLCYNVDDFLKERLNEMQECGRDLHNFMSARARRRTRSQMRRHLEKKTIKCKKCKKFIKKKEKAEELGILRQEVKEFIIENPSLFSQIKDKSDGQYEDDDDDDDENDDGEDDDDDNEKEEDKVELLITKESKFRSIEIALTAKKQILSKEIYENYLKKIFDNDNFLKVHLRCSQKVFNRLCKFLKGNKKGLQKHPALKTFSFYLDQGEKVTYETFKNLVTYNFCGHLKNFTLCNAENKIFEKPEAEGLERNQDEHRKSLFDEFLALVAPTLKELSIIDCPDVSNEQINFPETLVQKLELLEITQCPQITTEFLNKFETKNQDEENSLQALSLKSCNFSRKNAIKPIEFKKLTKLDLSDNRNLSNADFMKIIDSCPGLQDLNICNCKNVNLNFLDKALNYCLEIQSLKIGGFVTINKLNKKKKGYILGTILKKKQELLAKPPLCYLDLSNTDISYKNLSLAASNYLKKSPSLGLDLSENTFDKHDIRKLCYFLKNLIYIKYDHLKE